MLYYIHISLEGGETIMATKKAESTVKKTTIKKPFTAKVTNTNSNKVSTTLKNIFLTCGGKPIKSASIVSLFITEFIGTFLFVALFFAVTIAGMPLFAAFALVGIVLLTGAQINPAITIGVWVTRKMCALHALGYLVAQTLGATAAWMVLTTYLDATKSATTDLVANSGPALLAAAGFVDGTAVGKEWYVFFAELIGTMIIAFGFAAAINAGKKALTGAFAYGFALLVGLTIAGSLTAVFLSASGTSFTFLNPVLAFVANGVSMDMWSIAIYILAPIIGSVIGFVIYGFLKSQKKDNNEIAICNCQNCDCK